MTLEEIIANGTPEQVRKIKEAADARLAQEAATPEAQRAEAERFAAMSDREIRDWKVQHGGW